MILDDNERRKFAEYLKGDADSNRLLADQLEKLPGMEGMAKAKRTLAAAQYIVARELGNWESQTIG